MAEQNLQKLDHSEQHYFKRYALNCVALPKVRIYADLVVLLSYDHHGKLY